MHYTSFLEANLSGLVDKQKSQKNILESLYIFLSGSKPAKSASKNFKNS
jgi:hypothetical protein